MATFFNVETMELRTGCNTPDYIDLPPWVPYQIFSENEGDPLFEFPACPRKYWKLGTLEDPAPTEMTAQEKAAVDAAEAHAAFQNRTYDQITAAIFAAFDPAGQAQILAAFTAAFDLCLRKRDWTLCRALLSQSLQAAHITQAQFDTIDSILPENE